MRKAWQKWPGPVSSEAAQWGKSVGWDRPDLIQISTLPLISSVTLGTFLKLRVPYLLNRNVTVLFPKGYSEDEMRKLKA